MASPSSSASTRSGSPDDSSTYSDAPVSTVGLFHVPDLPGQVAASWVRRLVAVELEHAGFESANADALDELEGVVFSFFGSLVSHAHQLAEHGRRTRPTIKDVIQATKEFGVGGPHQLEQEIHRVEELDRPAPKVKYERRRVDRIGPLLASDDEDDRDGDDDDGHLTDEDGVGSGTKTTGHRSKSAVRRSTKREALLALEADYLPHLPAKHSYRQTPVFPIPAQPPAIPPSAFHTEQSLSAAAEKHLSSLRARLNDSQLVAASLRNLIRKTSGRTGAGAGAGTGTAMSLGAHGEGDGMEPRLLQEEDTDVVDYEGEWYGGQEPTRGDRQVVVLRYAPDGTAVDSDDRLAAQVQAAQAAAKKSFGAEWSDAGRVGSTAKRRKWRVG